MLHVIVQRTQIGWCRRFYDPAGNLLYTIYDELMEDVARGAGNSRDRLRHIVAAMIAVLAVVTAVAWAQAHGV